jgi:hypothetical protein
MLTDQSVLTVTCAWCGEQTAPDTGCQACDGDPLGPSFAPSGLAAVRERRLAARRQMLARRQLLAAPQDRYGDGGDPGSLAIEAMDEAPLAPRLDLAAFTDEATDVQAGPQADAQTDQPTGTHAWPSLPARRRRWSLRKTGAGLLTTAFVVAFIGAGALATRAVLHGRQAQEPAPVWGPFSGPDFSVQLPGHPVQATITGVVGADKLTATTWTAGQFGVGHTTLPPGADPVATGLAFAAEANDAVVSSSHRSQIGPFATEDAILRTSSGTVISVRVMAGPTDLWTLMATGTPTTWTTFLRSFDPGA